MKTKTETQGKMSWQKLLIAYLDFKSLREQSSYNYQRYIESFTRFFNSEFTDIDSITHEKVSNFRNHILCVRQCKNVTWNSYCRHFKALMKFGIENSLVAQKKIRLIVC
ncbi:phage integrase SAM-like domain-containing protein [Gilliamella sp. ESL0250]|uniref:phage integrase SAM-like domain-containing protein n=1 Tax=Gilliamella sp. ESL0250 TaxID=2705036 RepID=UPI00157FEE46|nr:phage integrase N-terminal SAM-like domain-containing protein [Gilliamella sp. ESL0250]NUF49592.1 hypothetical protein [Gilliamella sp. ESL0250]